ncbi:MAG: type restriction-modification system methyltransferase subunit [Deltaproteobacteria bacterium]|nr:type restriction-modification system methyltransferase subunit [Deltaproteobacteria bacterium]
MARTAKEKNGSVEEPLEKKLWKSADKLNKKTDAVEYKHIALGLIFLKYISDKNEYTAEKVFYVPPSARWNWLQGRAKLPTIGKDVMATVKNRTTKVI